MSGETIEIRWMVRGDVADAARIEAECYSEPWSADEFLAELSIHNGYGQTLLIGGAIVGYAIYRIGENVELKNIGIARSRRRLGLGSLLIDKLKAKCSPHRRPKLAAMVCENNLTAQLFLRSLGFRCVSIEHRPYWGSAQDGYRFEWSTESARCSNA
jgi:ribosomal-protein-alanine N-acetyltransferase